MRTFLLARLSADGRRNARVSRPEWRSSRVPAANDANNKEREGAARVRPQSRPGMRQQARRGEARANAPCAGRDIK